MKKVYMIKNKIMIIMDQIRVTKMKINKMNKKTKKKKKSKRNNMRNINSKGQLIMYRFNQWKIFFGLFYFHIMQQEKDKVASI